MITNDLFSSSKQSEELIKEEDEYKFPNEEYKTFVNNNFRPSEVVQGTDLISANYSFDNFIKMKDVYSINNTDHYSIRASLIRHFA